MYVPSRYRQTDLDTLQDFIHRNDFGTLVTYDGARPTASHLLMDVHRETPDKLTLTGHMARANKQWQSFSPEREVLAIFTGPHTYISPRWYNHVNVPTWNYQSVHLYGRPQIISDRDEVVGLLKALVDKYEAGAEGQQPYQVEALPADFLESQMQAVVAFKVEVTGIQASFKLSQNRVEEDFDNIVAQLGQRADDNSAGVAEAMRQIRPEVFGKPAAGKPG